MLSNENSLEINCGNGSIKYTTSRIVTRDILPDDAEILCTLQHPKHLDYFMNEDATILYKRKRKSGHVVGITECSSVFADYVNMIASLDGVHHQLSHIAWECYNKKVLPKYSIIDHIDGVRTNNRKENLILSSYALNRKITSCKVIIRVE